LTSAVQLKNEKQLLKQYYEGRQMESPNGGFLILLGIKPEDDGSALAMFECSACSLRYEITIPKGSRGERKAVKDALDAGHDPDCPRHGVGFRLARAGRRLVCNHCGVAYGRV
jgi:transcription elongation factor Elf1